ncbi:MAG: hypothetical protein Q8S00_32690 [Deltaproteobacteria bacterium]|nr:hypothetical protein [Deltaproteobacteria bacterium]
MDSSTLAIYKNLQTQVNRILYAMGANTIGVDGRIGSGTVAAVNKAMGTGFDTCDKVAILADTIAGQAKAKADSSGVPAVVPTPKPPVPPTMPNPGGGPPVGPTDMALRVGGFVNFLKSPLGMAVGVGSILALYAISKSRKR